MTKRTDVCIIGGGLVGTSIAYYLSRTKKKVVLLERKSIGSGTARATFGLLVIQLFKYFGVVDSYLRICRESLEMYMNLQEELKADFQYRQTGGLVVIKDKEDYKAKADLARTLQSKNVDVRILDRKQTMELAPALKPDDILGASFSPIEAELNPLLLADAFTRNAVKNGVEVFCDNPVTSIEMQGNRVHTVITPKERFHADYVVNAGGKWAGEVGKLVGVDIPMLLQRGQVLVTGVMEPLLDIAVQHIPPAETDELGRHLVRSTEIRQMMSGNLIMGGTREDHQTELAVTLEGITSIAKRAVDLVPAVRRARIIRAYSGVRNIPRDGLPVLGFVDEIEGWVNAVMHVGVTLAPISGKLIADLIDQGRPSLEIEDFAWSRFRK